MEPEKIRTLAVLLGVTPERLSVSLDMISGEEKEESFYPPKNPEYFYYNPNVFLKLHSIDYEGLRKLVVPDLRRLRR